MSQELSQLRSSIVELAINLNTQKERIVKECSPKSETGLIPAKLMPIAYHIATGQIIALTHVLEFIDEIAKNSEVKFDNRVASETTP